MSVGATSSTDRVASVDPPPADPAASPTPVPETAPVPTRDTPAREPASRPTRLRVPTAKVDAPVVVLGLDAQQRVEVPDNGTDSGWVGTTPVPGRPGPAVLAGHVSTVEGPAVFAHLADVAVGDPVILTDAEGRHVRFTVDGVETYPKDRFPTDRVYGPTPGPTLRLITCGGDVVAGRFEDNVVVYAS